MISGIEESRVSVMGGPLPGPRVVSLHMFPDVDRPSQLHTLLLMIWGQFIDHDLTRTAITEMHKEDGGGSTIRFHVSYDSFPKYQSL